MNSEVRSIMLERLRTRPPEECTVVKNSTPVYGFGRIQKAKIASISLNPSFHEFDLVQGQTRFHTLETLGVSDYYDLTEDHLAKVLDFCERYFERGIHFKQYFGQLESFIQQFIPTASYENGSMCHLDISQWATETVWGKLSKNQKNRIVSAKDIEFIRSLIQYAPYEILLINGKTASKEVLGKFFNVKYDEIVLPASEKVTCYYAEFDNLLGVPLGRTIRCFGWNRVVHYGIRKEHKKLIINWIKQKLGEVEGFSC